MAARMCDEVCAFIGTSDNISRFRVRLQSLSMEGQSSGGRLEAVRQMLFVTDYFFVNKVRPIARRYAFGDMSSSEIFGAFSGICFDMLRVYDECCAHIRIHHDCERAAAVLLSLRAQAVAVHNAINEKFVQELDGELGHILDTKMDNDGDVGFPLEDEDKHDAAIAVSDLDHAERELRLVEDGILWGERIRRAHAAARDGADVERDVDGPERDRRAAEDERLRRDRERRRAEAEQIEADHDLAIRLQNEMRAPVNSQGAPRRDTPRVKFGGVSGDWSGRRGKK